MKIFISHKAEDESAARRVAKHLSKKTDVECYLDVLDPQLGKNAEDLGSYFKRMISSCTHLMALVSSKTKWSWWVPFEIGIATEKDYPISTYAAGYCDLPSYLKKWPYLKTMEDLDIYVRIAKRTPVYESLGTATYLDRRKYANSFHRSLKIALGQGRY